MSLATYASEFKSNENNNPIQKKRENMKNRTLKRKEPLKSNPNIEAMIKKMHDDEDDEDDNISNFEPMQQSTSAGIERMSSINHMEDGLENRLNDQNQQLGSDKYKEGFTQLPGEYLNQYNKEYIPYYNQMSDDNSPNGVNKDELLTKLNQVIYLLEDQQDEKTGHVTEELILYSFLGVFIIFVVDSFARVGKYVR